MTATPSLAERRLAHPLRHRFAAPVTAYLTETAIVSYCAVGVVHPHVLSGRGRFQHDHCIRISDIQCGSRDGAYGVVQAVSQNRSAVGSFHAEGGRRSLVELLKILPSGFYLTPGQRPYVEAGG